MKIVAIVTFACVLCTPGFGQPAANSDQVPCPDLKTFLKHENEHGPNMAFCAKDSTPAAKAFCRNLALVQDYANANPGVRAGCFRTLVESLDVTDVNGMPGFISATGLAFATTAAISHVLHDAGQARPDRQLSANTVSSGTTSLVSKAGSAELLSLALDTGVLTQSVNGTTATLTTNADQVFRLITGNDPDCTVTCGSLGRFEKFESAVLNQVNVSTTVDLAQQNNTTVTTTGQASGATATPVSSVAIPTGAGKISGITARYQLMNKFDPRSQAFKDAWGKQVSSSLAKLVIPIGDDTEAVFVVLASHSPWSGGSGNASDADRAALSKAQAVYTDLPTAAEADSSGAKLKQAFSDYWSSVVTSDVMQDAKLGSAVAKVVKDRAIYRQAWFQAVNDAVGALLTFEYHYNHPLNQPYTDDFKLIYAYNFGTTGMLTFNGAISLYGTIPVGAQYGRVHYGQVSAQYDRTMTGQGKSLQTQLSLAGYWQYQPDPSVLNIPAGTVAPGTNIPLPNGTQEFVGTAGSLWVTQDKITIKGAGGINIPLGVSWSNKTDLLQGSKVGAQVGISYNFSSIAGLFSGGGQ